MSTFVYADNAATTKINKYVLEAMNFVSENEYANPSSIHSAGRDAANMISTARSSIATIVNSNSPDKIYFTSGGSEANNQALRTAVDVGKRTHRNKVLVSPIEHHSVLHTLEKMKANGEIDLCYLTVDSSGILNIDDLKNKIDNNTCLVSVMMVNNEIGTIQPIKEIVELAHDKHAMVHCDAVQAVGHMSIDVKNLGIDFLTASAHKFHGPKGVGFLYSEYIPSILINGGEQEYGVRAGTENTAGIVGMAIALEIANSCLDENTKRLKVVQQKIINELSSIDKSMLNGSLEQRTPNNINFCFDGVEGEGLLLFLDSKGICISTGSACTSYSISPSHVLKAIGLTDIQAYNSVRISIDESITDEQVDYLIDNIKQCVCLLRKSLF